MAKVNTKTKSVTQKVQEDKNVNPTDLAGENAKLKEELEQMMSNYKDMQLQLQNMLLAQQNLKGRDDEEELMVGCRIFNGAWLSSEKGDISIFIGYKDEVGIKITELREIFKNPFGYKQMFIKGSLYFKNEEDYKKFNIRKDFDLSDEGIKELLAKPSNQVIEEVKKITNEKKNLTQVFVLLYQIASLIDTNDIDIKYETRNALERYFDVDFVDIINNLHS